MHGESDTREVKSHVELLYVNFATRRVGGGVVAFSALFNAVPALDPFLQAPLTTPSLPACALMLFQCVSAGKKERQRFQKQSHPVVSRLPQYSIVSPQPLRYTRVCRGRSTGAGEPAYEGSTS